MGEDFGLSRKKLRSSFLIFDVLLDILLYYDKMCLVIITYNVSESSGMTSESRSPPSIRLSISPRFRRIFLCVVESLRVYTVFCADSLKSRGQFQFSSFFVTELISN